MKIHALFDRYVGIIASLVAAGFAGNVIGVCPVCTVAAGAGVGVAQWLGVDDSVTGLWVGGLIVSVSLWTLAFLDRHNIVFLGKTLIVPVLYYASTIVPLYSAGLFAQKHGRVFGISKLLLGIILGSILFVIGTCWSSYLKRKNFGRVRFAYQKIIIPTSLLVIFSFILCCITK